MKGTPPPEEEEGHETSIVGGVESTTGTTGDSRASCVQGLDFARSVNPVSGTTLALHCVMI